MPPSQNGGGSSCPSPIAAGMETCLTDDTHMDRAVSEGVAKDYYPREMQINRNRIVPPKAQQLMLPQGIPIAARDIEALQNLGTSIKLSSFTDDLVCGLRPIDRQDEASVYVNPEFRNYIGAWNAAARTGIVDHRASWGKEVDIDHVYPGSWAGVSGMTMNWVRLFPV